MWDHDAPLQHSRYKVPQILWFSKAKTARTNGLNLFNFILRHSLCLPSPFIPATSRSNKSNDIIIAKITPMRQVLTLDESHDIVTTIFRVYSPNITQRKAVDQKYLTFDLLSVTLVSPIQ